MRRAAWLGMVLAFGAGAAESTKLPYNHPGLVVDLGVGLWAHPFPLDYDKDGDVDLLVGCTGKPSNGIYFFENPGGDPEKAVFKPGKLLTPAPRNISISYTPGGPMFTRPGFLYPDFVANNWSKETEIVCSPPVFEKNIRANQWKFVDYDGDGPLDLIIGIGYWGDYGWDDAYNEKGEWTNGPLHGYVYVLRNSGSDAAPVYEAPVQLATVDGPVDTYGCPSPNFADFDGDGDLDLVCGEFLDKLTYFENIGTRTAPRYAAGRHLTHDGEIIRHELQMLQVCAFDWNGDGHTDLLVGEEDGRVAYVKHSGKVVDGMPQFELPVFFKQEAENVKVGALATPFSIDWDNDGDEDLVVGDTAGYINFVENMDGGDTPKWAAPVRLAAAGEIIRIQAGENGSIQGPCEAKWGYTVLNVADWNHDGKPDIVINSIWGSIDWYENVGEVGAPKLAAAKPIEVAWEGPAPKPAWNWWNPEGKNLVTQWRTSPLVRDLNGDGLTDLAMLDQEGYLAFFERSKDEKGLRLNPPKRIFFDEAGEPLRLNERPAGGSGRRKLAFADWDGDGKLDLLVNSESVNWLRNISDDPAVFTFKDMGRLDTNDIGAHASTPTTVDFDGNGVRDLLTGAEDGFFYYLPNSRAAE